MRGEGQKMTIEKDNGDEKKEGGISVLHPGKNEFIQFQDAENGINIFVLTMAFVFLMR